MRALAQHGRAEDATISRPDEQSRADREAIGYLGFAGIAVALGVALRVLIVLPGQFPLGDGGLFYVMVRDLQAAHFHIPAFTSYNGGHIPFAYPPLGLYAAAILQQTTGAGLPEIFRFLPLFFACLALGAFALLARALLPSVAAIGATFVFAVLPDSFDMEIKGGGLTRAPGELFAILALWQVYRLVTTGLRRNLIGSMAFVSLTALSHPEWAQFVVLSSILMWWFPGKSVPAAVFHRGRRCAGTRNDVPPDAFARGPREAGRDLLVVGAASLAVTAPWWADVVARHGAGPFLGALTGNAQVFPLAGSLRALVTLELTHESWLPMGTVLALAGLVVCLQRRRWLLPGWLALVLLSDARGWAIPLVIPVALLAGTGIAAALQVLAPDASRLRGKAAWILPLGLGLLLARSLLAAEAYEQANNPPVSPAERAAMTWIAGHTPRAARFLVIGAAAGSSQEDVEWFPALTGRVSVETVQGLEWVPGAYARTSQQIQELQACLPDVSCMQRVLSAAGVPFDYVYVATSAPGNVCTAVCQELRASPAYAAAYRNLGAWVFRKLG